MSFTSCLFLIGLLPWFCVLYARLGDNALWKRQLIFLANSVFYIWGGVGAFAIVWGISAATWLLCAVIRARRCKALLLLGCGILLVPLFAYKYLAFIADIMRALSNASFPSFALAAPLGISFFTFEAISCLCDVYRGEITEPLSFPDIYLYLTFFPTVTAGPILRIAEFRRGLSNATAVCNYDEALGRIVRGLCKKTLLADKLSILVNYYFDGVSMGNAYSSLGLWIGSIAYTLQLYYDFSGYSDIAIGIGHLLGFEIRENFRSPYRASSVQDFWRRWHISLSQWFRDYVYIPLGGSRCSAPKYMANLFAVWLLTGIWHGADWTFLLWGMGYFALLLIERYVPFMKQIGAHWYGHLYAMFFVNLLWIPFRAANIETAGRYIAKMFAWGENFAILENISVRFLPFLILSVALCFPLENLVARWRDRVWYPYGKAAALLAGLILSVSAMVNSAYTPYIYGSF